ncbi:MAG: chemotaxis protein CheW [Beijerinckiaceae bacterium]|jgi:purine-binding chemotaxis protein CheW
MTRVELKRRAPARLSDGRMRREPAEHAAERVFVVHVGAETMGLPIDRVRTVFFVGDVARVPLTPPWVLGLINLRGAIVTAISLRARLGLPDAPRSTGGLHSGLAIAVDVDGDSFAIVVDKVGEVIDVASGAAATIAPVGMSNTMRRLTSRVYARASGLLPIIDLRAVVLDDGPSVDFITKN